MAIRSRLAELIANKEAQEGRRLTLKRLAQETGLAQPTLRHLVYNTTQRFDAPVLDALCVYFGVPLSELLVHEQGEHVKMSYQIPDSLEQAMSTLKIFYPATLDLMDEVFTSHEFILKLGQNHQREYIGALATCINASAPFQTLHAQLAKTLHDFSDLIELIEREAPSVNIWGDMSHAAKWRKI